MTRSPSGWMIVDKPVGVTSAYVVSIIKRLLRNNFRDVKIGHGGTLDQLATGVLPIAIGEATKTVPYVMDATKDYTFTVRWGEERATDDADGPIIAQSSDRPSIDDILRIMDNFRGSILQSPPVYSALKIDGKRASDRCRQGETIMLAPRPVTIHRFVLENHTEDTATFGLTCSKGTYVRSIARDMGRALGCKGYVTFLRRDRVGAMYLFSAIGLGKIQNMSYKDLMESSSYVSLRTVLDDIPAVPCDTDDENALRRGRPIGAGDISPASDVVVCVGPSGDPIAMARMENGLVYPIRVFNI